MRLAGSSNCGRHISPGHSAHLSTKPSFTPWPARRAAAPPVPCRPALLSDNCHPVLPYSNWEWATVCHSESMAAIKRGVQAAVFRLGKMPRYHQTDNSTSATHDLRNGKRGFNAE